MPCVFSYPPGGIMSSFLMGCYDPDSKKWCTVTKCSGGYDDSTLARLQKELDVIKISKVREDPLRGLPGILNWCNKIEKLIFCLCSSLCRSQAKSPAGWKSSRTIIQISLFAILRWDFAIQHICISQWACSRTAELYIWVLQTFRWSDALKASLAYVFCR